MKENIISLRGDKELWLEFAIAVKRKREQIWGVLKPFIKKYIKDLEKKKK